MQCEGHARSSVRKGQYLIRPLEHPYSVIGVVLIFGPPLVIASVMLSPQGLAYTLDCVLRYAGVALLLFPIFAWPTFLIQVAAPLPGQSRFRAIIGLWLGGAVLVSAVMNLLGSMGDYSSRSLPFNPAGHTLIPYGPRAGLYLGTFTLCMLLGSGIWGALARIVPVQFVLRAAIVTGLLLFGDRGPRPRDMAPAVIARIRSAPIPARTAASKQRAEASTCQ